jgi:hypothetical protein
MTPAPATPAPTATSSPAAPPTPGEPPRERWDAILSNARAKAKQEAETAARTKYGWADQFQADPYTFVDSWIDQLAVHPEHAPKLFAKAARLLQSRRGRTQESAPEEPQPDIPVLNGEGQVVNHTYSAKQSKAWHEWKATEQDAALAERFAPLERMRHDMEQFQRDAHARQEAVSHATTRLTALRQNPIFVQHEARIKQALEAHEEWGDDINQAFAYVLTTHVIPEIERTRDTKTLLHLKQQAAGSTVSPNGQVGTTTPKFKSFAEAARYYAEHPESMPA